LAHRRGNLALDNSLRTDEPRPIGPTLGKGAIPEMLPISGAVRKMKGLTSTDGIVINGNSTLLPIYW